MPKAFLRPFSRILLYCSLASSAMANSGESLYMLHCAQCHGEKLEGGNGSSFIDGVWSFGERDQHIFRNTKYGILNVGMPAWQSLMSDAEIASIVKYIRENERRSNLSPFSLPSELETEAYAFELEVVAEGLQLPWSIAFLDSSTAVITERAGRLLLWKAGETELSLIVGSPEVLSEGQGGLLDVAIDPVANDEDWIYLSYSHKKESLIDFIGKPHAMTRVERGRIRDNAWVDAEVIYEAPSSSYLPTRSHYGSRFAFDDNGFLYFSIGDRGRQDHAQSLSKPNGKIHRIRKDGSIPPSNPFVGQPGALGSIFSYGHRNPQGLARHPETGEIWSTEHGPMGGDELNRIVRGLNYGWPIITHGLNYNGSKVSDFTEMDGMEQPKLDWTPSIAVSSIAFYRGKLFAKWENSLLVGSLKYRDLLRLEIKGDEVVHSEAILSDIGRVRDVEVCPDGYIYVVLNAPDVIVRLTPLD